MADLQQLEAALRNADAAGDVEAARSLAQAVAQARTTQQPPATAAKPSSFVTGLADPVHGLAQLMTNMLPAGIVKSGDRLNNWLADKTGLVARLPEGGVDQQVREREAAYQAQRVAAGETGFDWGRLAGNVLNPANVAVAARLPAAASLAGRIGIGATGGAVSSALNPVGSGDFAEEKAKQMALGAAFGGAVPAVAAGLGRVISPMASKNADLGLLRAEGVKPTVGQILGGRWNALEEKLQSLPIMGDAIANARGRALQQFNTAAINRATAPIGVRVEGVGQSAVSEAGDAVSQAYNNALGSMKFLRFDQKFGTDLAQLQQMAQSLTPPMRAKFNATLQDVVGGRVSTAGTMLPETFKKVESEIGNQASRYGRSAVASEQELGDALKQLQDLLRQQVGRADPSAADAIKAANQGWANLVRVEGAAKGAKNAEGVFTPAQLNTAIQAADQSVRKRAVARGDALMQDLGTAGQNVLGNKIPNSFTTDRALIAGGGLGAGLLNPAIPAGLLAGAGLYTKPMQGLLAHLVSTRPQAAQQVAGLLQQTSPMLVPTGALFGLQIGQ